MPAAPRTVPAAKEDLTNKLIDKFKQLIAQGLLTPGAKLPPERDLAPRFGVSRSTLRHALKVLENMGVLYQRVGDGTYLRDAFSAELLDRPLQMLILMDGITASELLETRRIVEPEIAALAAERATTKDLEELNRTIEGFAGKRPDQPTMIEADIEFHRAIFHAAGNRLSERIFPVIHRAMLGSIAITAGLVDWSHTLAFHKPIYQAIRRRDPADARRRMVEHLHDAQNLLKKAGSQPDAGRLLESITPVV